MAFQPSIRSALLLVCSVAAASGGGSAEADRPRVRTRQGNVVADDGTRLRGTAFFLDLFDTEDFRAHREEYRETFRKVSRDYHLNCVRICPWIGTWDYDVGGNRHHRESFVDMVDAVVDWCGEDDIHAVVNLHTKFGTEVDPAKAKAFWDVFAPRYADRTHVAYELINEPEESSSLANMAELYRHVRGIAPDTHLILFSPNNASKITLDELKAASVGIDYANASFGWHCYEWYADKPVEWRHAFALRRAGVPVICTEFFSLDRADNMPIDWEHLIGNIRFAEKGKFSWMQWGPFAQRRNTNKPGWDEAAVGFRERYREEIERAGVAWWE